MESREEEQEEDSPRSPDVLTTTTDTTTSTTTTAASSTLTTSRTPDDQTDRETEEEEEEDEEKEGEEDESIFISSSQEAPSVFFTSSVCLPAGEPEQSNLHTGAVGDEFVSEQKQSTPTGDRPAPPSSLALSRPTKKKKVLVAPALSLSLGRSESTVSDDFPSSFLSPSPEDDDDTGPDFDLDDDLRRLGVASRRRRAFGSGLRSGFDSRTGSGRDQSGLGALEREDVVDGGGTRWRCFSTGDPPQESRVNMSVLEPFLRVLSHGGYYGDGVNDIIVFSSCYLPENRLENYQYVMDNLFR
ncbi:caytaxin-like isoform X2 [Anarrhichthys ocellatus]|uniref:caytaxin-like isoform X2 n=1 Tax=Anarrhichthys ocellatus TaxID=433405 RepID=UPI0012EE60DE|nr:caytaxin-like isoform X2 [Anarrhichthys ocellatus]